MTQGEIPTFKSEITVGECLRPAMTVTEPEHATAYLEAYVDHIVSETNKPRAECEDIAHANLGYWAGYYDAETRERVERLFKCSHPVFGAIAERGEPTQEEAFEAGKKMGAALCPPK